jgi:hypothetical protein
MDRLKRREVPLVELRWRQQDDYPVLQYKTLMQVVDTSGMPTGAVMFTEWVDIPIHDPDGPINADA